MIAVLRSIEKHAELNELQRRLTENQTEAGRITHAGVDFGPCVLISREAASGGGSIAKLVGERLAWHVYDSEIVDEIARKAHVRKRLAESVDEHMQSAWARIWRETIPMGEMVDQDYVRYLKQVLTALGHLGHVVLVGRGASFLLPTRCAVRVRVVAPFEARCLRLAQTEGCTADEAGLKIRKIDASRASFAKTVFRKDIAAPENYDLVVNTAELSMAAAATVIAAAVHQKIGV